MNPIISLSFDSIETNRGLVLHSLLIIVVGTTLIITMAFFVSEIIGWKLAGSELIGRMNPSLLDLGIAIAARAIAAFFYTHPSASSTLAGIAIAVALVPSLGISMDNLLVRNLVHRSLTVKTQELVLADRDVRLFP